MYDSTELLSDEVDAEISNGIFVHLQPTRQSSQMLYLLHGRSW